MQDPGAAFGVAQLKPLQFPAITPPLLEDDHHQQQLRCPRCDSTNTKFCYYNNYNLSQPRHFCKSCRRYWTKGGSLRNIPVGGGTRKSTSSSSKRSSSSKQRPSSNSSVPSSTAPPVEKPGPKPEPGPPVGPGMELPVIGSFTSLLAASSGGQFGNLLFEEGSGLGSKPGSGDGAVQNNLGLELQGSGFLGAAVQSNGAAGDSSCWSGGGNSNNGWPDLAIYTPGSRFL